MTSSPADKWVEQAATARARGDHQAAVEACLQALAKDAGHGEAARHLSELTQQTLVAPSKNLSKKGLIAALGLSHVERQKLALLGLRVLRGTTRLGPIFEEGKAQGWDAAAKRLLTQSSGHSVCKDPLFQALLSSDICADPFFEELITAVRRHLLLDPAFTSLPKGPVARVLVPLISQFAMTEFVQSVDAVEADALHGLATTLSDETAGQTDRAWALCRLLMYGEVTTPGSEELAKAIPGLEDWLRQSRDAKALENAYAAGFPVLGGSDDATSKAVTAFYEETPYPRWRSHHLGHTGDRRRYLEALVGTEALAFLDAPFDVWIAGSGTGRQVLSAHVGYGPNAHILATDLSRPSLAYAKRSLEAFGIEDVEFAVSDILAAGSLERSFHIIESVGVLHHMADPFRAWGLLVDRLKPGGIMRIGLYSQAARQAITRIRTQLQQNGLEGTPETIRSVRRQLISANDQALETITRSVDFFSLWNVRDLIFHTHERPVTLAEIGAFLGKSGLRFLAMESSAWLAGQFRDFAPPGAATNDLKAWETVETRQPDAFKGMYVFWCQKDGGV